jgi:hypothetical protein
MLAVHPVVAPEAQEIPTAALVTVPVPVPPIVTVTAKVGTVEAVKVAVTLVAAVMVIWQVRLVPEQAPPHPPKV